jgi:GT2 family glycosyltransferase
MGKRSDYKSFLLTKQEPIAPWSGGRALAAADPCMRVLDNPFNLGFGGSYRRGARAATATYVMMFPGDGSM